MRVKQTAKKITTENTNNVTCSDISYDTENIEQNSCDNPNDISDNEVEILVECRRDQEGNQFLLDGTLVIEPAAVDINHEYKENQDSTKEINFDQFIKEMEVSMPQESKVKYSTITPKRNVPSFGPNSSVYTNVKCTACNNKFNPYIGDTLFKHPLLEVVLCSDCIQNQKEEFFIIDKEDNKETLCRWCVEGGSLICCDFCPKSFCKTCIKRNLGRVTLTEILNQDDSVQWRCFACDPKHIEPLKIAYRKVYNDVQEFVDKQRFQKLSKKSAPKLTEIVNKKRSIAKAFPIDVLNGSPNVTAAKVASPSSQHNTKPSDLLNSMSNFGTDWYMRNVKLNNIFTEIEDIDSRSLLNAINSTKKCIEAFYSDIRNLEVQISKASTASDIPAIVSMFKSVYRHHLFNRFSQVKARIEEDRNTAYVIPSTAAAAVTHNGTTKEFIRNTNSIPSLVINNVVSTAAGILSRQSFPSVNVSQRARLAVNGHGPVNTVLESIDLTDEPDRPESEEDAVSLSPPPSCAADRDDGEEEKCPNTAVTVVTTNCGGGGVTTTTTNNRQHNENDVVDLCADEDDASVTYSLVTVHSVDTANDRLLCPPGGVGVGVGAVTAVDSCDH